jgi:hypothetical protein
VEVVSLVFGAIGAALGGYVSGRKTPPGIAAALARIEARLEESVEETAARFRALESRLEVIEARSVQTSALMGAR